MPESDMEINDLDSAMDMDFTPDEGGMKPAEIKRKFAKTRQYPMDIFTSLLIVSAVFYLLALLATLAEMAKYCTSFLWLG
ncbi:MAG: hypothetical protein JXA52_01310 [Planctomycetes bacterium]|nr:hypothetical protein [Planctomycetota bacterium]